jgi:hypothetical protein
LVPLFKEGEKQGVLVHLCNSSTQKAEAGGLKAGGQPGLHKETPASKNQPPQKKKKAKKEKVSNLESKLGSNACICFCGSNMFTYISISIIIFSFQ